MPKYTATIDYSEVKGKIDDYFYAASGYSVVIEIEKEGDIARRLPAPVYQPVAVKELPRDSGMDWVYAAGVLLIVGAAVVVVATVVEDIITAGAGAINDPASFALAATMTKRGLVLLNGGSVVATQIGGAAFSH